MAIAMKFLLDMCDKDILSPGYRILDIGCSNLYSADEVSVANFLKRFDVEDEAFVKYLAGKSAEKAAFAGELFEKCGLGYNAIDFAVDFKTTKFDLNSDDLTKDFHGVFDLVLNFGTTEHVINQANAFRVVHQAAKHNGFIYHQLPAGGFFNHCYFLYTGRFFFDLAGYNEYDVRHAWLEQNHFSKGNLMDAFRDYASYFPVLKDAPHQVQDYLMSDTGINVIYQKIKNVAFRYPMELSTAYTKPI